MRKAIMGSLLVWCSLFGVAQQSVAGLNSTATFPGTCTLSGTTTTCIGSMAGIRNQIQDRSRLAIFIKDSTGFNIFVAVINNVSFTCFAPAGNDQLWTAAMSASYFFVQYDANGVCSFVSISSSSDRRNASAL
jgi:hypothetical protein